MDAVQGIRFSSLTFYPLQAQEVQQRYICKSCQVATVDADPTAFV
jgi:hypothetical protein